MYSYTIPSWDITCWDKQLRETGAVMQLEATVAASHARATVLVWELRSLQQFSLCAFVTPHEQVQRFDE